MYVDADFPNCLDTNFLLIEGVPSHVSADDIVMEARRAFPGRGSRSLRVVLEDPALARQLEPHLRERGWRIQRFLLMVHRRSIPLPTDLSRATECSLEEARPLLEEVIRRGSGAGDESETRMLIDFRAKVANKIGTRFFVAPVDGSPAGVCELYLNETDAQIDVVNTLEESRGRGNGTAVVLSAVEAALEVGARWIHLYTDAENWPQRWYRRLGFEDAGTVVELGS